MEFPDLPPLSYFDGRKKERVWRICVEGNSKSKTEPATIVTRHGLKGGKITEAKKVIKKGKNIGKKNETTPYSQAYSEAKSKWTEKKSELELSVKPMLAHEFGKHSNKVNYPCYVQPKLDGVRALITQTPEGEIKILSREGKEYLHLNHIKKEMKKYDLFSPETLAKNNEDTDYTKFLKNYKGKIIYDGELYSNVLSFKDISGTCRRETIRKKEHLENITKIKFHCFDMFFDTALDTPFIDRYSILSGIFDIFDLKSMDLVEVQYIKRPKKSKESDELRGEEAIRDWMSRYLEQGYEGVMVRNSNGIYKMGRSYDLLKLKEFHDSEFEIVDFTEGAGVEAGCVVWICKREFENEKGETVEKEFNVRPKGTHEERKLLFENGDEYIGKQLTVKFQEYTEYGVPRFPVGIAIRDYE